MVTNPQRKRISDLIYRKENFNTACPSTMYIGLATGSISDEGVITGEPVGGGYSRVAVSMDTNTWSAPDTNAVCRNKINISFPETTTSIGNIAYIFLSDVATGGTAYYYMAVNPPKAVQANTTVYFTGDPTGATGNIELSTSN